jgi:hypothetical protein
MKQVSNEQDVIQLLANLKQAENNYPSDLLLSRREMFVKQAASAAVAMDTAMKMNNGTNAGNAAPAASSAPAASIGKLLEIVLITAIVVEAGAAAYLYRDNIADFINSIFSPRVEQVANPPDTVDIPNTGNAGVTETPSATLTDTAVPTDTLLAAPLQNDNDNDNGAGGGEGSGSGGGDNPPAVSTPEPTKPGLHLGQTPRPERTQPAPSKESQDK